MPISKKTQLEEKKVEKLRMPQVRVLSILYPKDRTRHWIDWPFMRTAEIARIMGTSEVSETMRRAMRGLPESRRLRIDADGKRRGSGTPHLGLVDKKYVTESLLDICGVSEIRYRITQDGIDALDDYLKNGGKIPALRPRESSVNDRYKEKGGQE